ncbi:MAG: hypothetical protein PWP23_3086 [Candidatus Sumerlaeota bacterium]|nr:hypothetical protein [Candidatus Sumerlaeota bacterium]
MILRYFNPLLWGVSIALSWTWGLGLFFSVQMAIEFGMVGLLLFAIPNAIGLLAFGWITQTVAKKAQSSLEFEKHFLKTVGNLRWVSLFYQIVAIALTFFALFRYVLLPLSESVFTVYMAGLLVLGAGLLLGEQFDIARLKWSHLGFAVVIVLSILLIGWGGASYFHAVNVIPSNYMGVEPIFTDPATGDARVNWRFIGYFIPIVIGFLIGPWLDIQQWQRAIQIRRESTNIRTAYIFGSLLFFGILVFHGSLGLAIWGEGVRLGVTGEMVTVTTDGLFHAKDAVVRFLFTAGVENVPLLFRVMYIIFLCLCIVATLDSGYVALKWFQTDTVKKTDSVLMSLVPKGILESPIPPFLLAGFTGLVGLWAHWELEYYMSFYASFLVGYAIVFLFRTVFEPRFTAFTQTTLVSVAALSLGVFGLGYFEEIWLLMATGAVIPLTHAFGCVLTRKAVEEIKRSGVIDKVSEAVSERTAFATDALGTVPDDRAGQPPEEPERAMTRHGDSAGAERALPPSQGGASSWFEGKWFIHRLVATYQDTNSVGNVYFAQYAMWVGKTRELFFNQVLPDFDLKTTEWFILTRAFEHKYLKETVEFETVEVKIRVSGFNRKFVTMEHHVYDSAKTLLGKGKQVLLFVSSKDYRIIDIPPELYKAFIPYL